MVAVAAAVAEPSEILTVTMMEFDFDVIFLR